MLLSLSLNGVRSRRGEAVSKKDQTNHLHYKQSVSISIVVVFFKNHFPKPRDQIHAATAFVEDRWAQSSSRSVFHDWVMLYTHVHTQIYLFINCAVVISTSSSGIFWWYAHYLLPLKWNPFSFHDFGSQNQIDFLIEETQLYITMKVYVMWLYRTHGWWCNVYKSFIEVPHHDLLRKSKRLRLLHFYGVEWYTEFLLYTLFENVHSRS